MARPGEEKAREMRWCNGVGRGFESGCYSGSFVRPKARSSPARAAKSRSAQST